MKMGDVRLDKRLVKAVGSLTENASCSILISGLGLRARPAFSLLILMRHRYAKIYAKIYMYAQPRQST